MKETPLRAIEILHAQAGPAASRADGSLRLSFITPELLSSQAGACIQLHGKNVRLTIIPEDVDAAETVTVQTERETKSPSLRLRNVLYALHQHENVQEPFQRWYESKLEAIINHYKDKLP